MENTIRIAVADDHPIVRKGIIDFILAFEGFNVIMEASDGDELIDQLRGAPELPDICILDISMPHLNGYKTLKEIKRNWSIVKVLIFSAYYDEFSVTEMFSNGANGFLKKNSRPKQLQQALASIYYNDFYLTESVSGHLSNLQRKYQHIPKITDREMEFLCNCCSELNYKEIAELMGISVRTAEAFRDALFAKFDINTRAGLVMFAFQNGIVSLSREKKDES